MAEKWGEKKESSPLRSKRGGGVYYVSDRIFLTSSSRKIGNNFCAHTKIGGARLRRAVTRLAIKPEARSRSLNRPRCSGSVFWKSIGREATSRWSTRMKEDCISVPCGGGSFHLERSLARRRGGSGRFSSADSVTVTPEVFRSARFPCWVFPCRHSAC